MNYMEVTFEEGGRLHSRFSEGIVQVNTLNRDYQDQMQGSPRDKLAYAALMIGKETIAYNDRSGAADEFLERFLSYYFYIRTRTSARSRSSARPATAKKG